MMSCSGRRPAAVDGGADAQRGHVLKTKKSLVDGPAQRPDGPRSGQSAVVVRTVRACAESVRIPSFSRGLLPKTTGLARETV
jgi:hypothetical protein